MVQSGELDIHVVGVADAYGNRMTQGNKRAMKAREEAGLIKFYLVPVKKLCTEDNVPLLGIHYIGYDNGPRIIPAAYIKGFYNAYKKFWILMESKIKKHID